MPFNPGREILITHGRSFHLILNKRVAFGNGRLATCRATLFAPLEFPDQQSFTRCVSAIPHFPLWRATSWCNGTVNIKSGFQYSFQRVEGGELARIRRALGRRSAPDAAETLSKQKKGHRKDRNASYECRRARQRRREECETSARKKTTRIVRHDLHLLHSTTLNGPPLSPDGSSPASARRALCAHGRISPPDPGQSLAALSIFVCNTPAERGVGRSASFERE